MALTLPMCFKKPKLPPKSAEDIKTEDDLKAIRIAQQREIAAGLKTEKDSQTDAAFARIMGMTGNRSLITGPKGGMGYMGGNRGRSGGRPIAAPNAPVLPLPTAPPIMTAPSYTGFVSGTGGSLIGDGGYGSFSGPSYGGGGYELNNYVQER